VAGIVAGICLIFFCVGMIQAFKICPADHPSARKICIDFGLILVASIFIWEIISALVVRKNQISQNKRDSEYAVRQDKEIGLKVSPSRSMSDIYSGRIGRSRSMSGSGVSRYSVVKKYDHRRAASALS